MMRKTAQQKDKNKARKPPWLRVPFPGGSTYDRIKAIVRRKGLHTVCKEAVCPNLAECWSHGTATFMILGNTCTRSCGFCGVSRGVPHNGIDRHEAVRVAQAAAAMGLKHVVVTSVTRDDLDDGGASLFAQTVRQIRRRCPEAKVEILVPDFQGDRRALQQVIHAGPHVLAHNVETVPRLYKRVRPQAEYGRSLRLLRRAKAFCPGILTKSGVMVGLGEKWTELRAVMEDLRGVDCDILTIGQYLRPGKDRRPITRYYRPAEFEALKWMARKTGFWDVKSAPLVRSSYRADQLRKRDP